MSYNNEVRLIFPYGNQIKDNVNKFIRTASIKEP